MEYAAILGPKIICQGSCETHKEMVDKVVGMFGILPKGVKIVRMITQNRKLSPTGNMMPFVRTARGG